MLLVELSPARAAPSARCAEARGVREPLRRARRHASVATSRRYTPRYARCRTRRCASLLPQRLRARSTCCGARAWQQAARRDACARAALRSYAPYAARHTGSILFTVFIRWLDGEDKMAVYYMAAAAGARGAMLKAILYDIKKRRYALRCGVARACHDAIAMMLLFTPAVFAARLRRYAAQKQCAQDIGARAMRAEQR